MQVTKRVKADIDLITSRWDGSYLNENKVNNIQWKHCINYTPILYCLYTGWFSR
jgi:hypothetical protein